MKREIKSDLFRFVTLRGPQLLSEEEKAKGFIFHPDLEESALYSAAPTEETSVVDRTNQLKETAAGTTHFTATSQVKALNPEMYSFALWLSKNRQELFSRAALAEKAAGVTALHTTFVLQLWENVFYQTITRESVQVREAAIQMLVADHFINNADLRDPGIIVHEPVVTEPEFFADFTILANAKLVVPKALVAAQPQSLTVQNSAIDSSRASAEIAIQDKLALLQQYNNSVEELQSISKKYDAAEGRAYKAAYAAYQDSVKDTVNNLPSITAGAKASEDGEASPFTNLLLPEFTYAPENPLTEAYLGDKLTTEAMEVFTNLQLSDYSTIGEAITGIEAAIRKLNNSILVQETPAQKVVVFNGKVIETNIITGVLAASDPLNTLYGYRLCTTNSPAQTADIEINCGYAGATVTACTATAQSNMGNTATDTHFTTLSINGNNIKLKLFTVNTLAGFTGKSMRITGQVTFSNGYTLAFDSTLSFDTCTSGIATLLSTGTSGGSKIIGIHQMGIADYRKVEQEVCCYLPGEVSHIENVLKGEYKERATRRLRREETTTESTSERETENLTDVTSTERNEMHNETSRVLAADRSVTANATVSGKWGGVGFTAGTGYASNTSQTDSNSAAVSYAKDVTARAMERVVQKITEKRTVKMIDEFEENNKHGFDNRGEGSANISGVYRWVDKEYKNQVVNYGRRLMYEIMVPEPARFLSSMPVQAADSAITVLQKPIDPRTYISSAALLTAANYQYYAALYNAEVKAYPSTQLTVSKAFQGKVTSADPVGECQAIDGEIEIPEGYMATTAYGAAGFNYLRNDIEFSGYTLSIGDKFTSCRSTRFDDRTFLFTLGNNISAKLGVAVKLTDVGSFACSVAVTCVLTTEAKEQWQNDTYTRILNAYEVKKAAYDKAVADLQATTGTVATSYNSTQYNPLWARTIEQGELKKNCLQLLLEPYGYSIGANTVKADGTININTAFGTHADKVKFFEAAFEWEIMDYIFYPYYWADTTKWQAMFKQEDGDPLFKAFLQSGMGKVVLSVRPGFEAAVMYYLETGQIWDGKDIALDDDLYLSIMAEQLPIEGTPVGEPWQTKLPTSLTILQNDSVAVTETGLPCNCDDDGTGTGIESNDNRLTALPQG